MNPKARKLQNLSNHKRDDKKAKRGRKGKKESPSSRTRKGRKTEKEEDEELIKEALEEEEITSSPKKKSPTILTVQPPCLNVFFLKSHLSSYQRKNERISITRT